jgi:DNA polymerase alpha subunit B
MKVAPDILIIPSKLTTMVRDIYGTLVINGGQLTKGNSGGTYCEIVVHPLPEEELRDAIIDGKGPRPARVVARTRVDINKI